MLRLKKLLESLRVIINKIDTPIWLEIFFLILIILRIPSFFEPYYYGDEMIYLALGEGARQGIPWYSALHDNKPPLLYLIAAISGNLFVFKAILAFWNLATVYVFWKLVNTLFPKKVTLQKVSTVIFGLLTTLPLLEGNTVNAELFMIGPVIFAFWIILSKENNFKNLLLAGASISVGALFKIPSAFDILALIFFFFAYTSMKWSSIKNFIFKAFTVSLGFLIPIALTFVWYYFAGSFKEYLIAAFLQNFGYLNSWRPEAKSVSFLEKQGPLLIRAGVMFLGLLTLYLSKKKLSRQFVFVSSWLIVTLFAVTLSERPYPHYFVQSVAPLSILLGMLLTLETIEQSLVVIPLTLAFFVPFYYKFWYYPTGSYYMRFINLITKQISKEEYLKSFSPHLKRNYEIAKFISESSTKKDRVFVWGNDSAAIYSLSRRMPPLKYVADYHIVDFSTTEETITTLSKTLPKFIVITPNSFDFPELQGFLVKNYYIISEIDSSQIWLYIKR